MYRLIFRPGGRSASFNEVQMIAVILVFIVLLFEASVSGQSAGQAPNSGKPSTVATHSWESLALQARLSSPELGADSLLRIASSKLVFQKDYRAALIDEAFQLSRRVKNPVRLKTVPVAGTSVDTETGYLGHAFDLKLDGLSLMSRAVTAMVPLDKDRARQMLHSVNGGLKLRPRTCSDTQVYDLTDIYKAAIAVGKQSFTKREVQDGVRAIFLSVWVDGIESPSQIGPALDLVTEFNSSPADRQLLTTLLARSLRKNLKDDRSYTYALERDQILSKVVRLLSGPDNSSKNELRLAFKDSIALNLGAQRCRGNELRDRKSWPTYATEINRLFPDDPVLFESINNKDSADGPNINRYWVSAKSKSMMGSLRTFQKDAEGETLDPDNRHDEKYDKLMSLLDALENWKADEDETESRVFNQKCVIYRSLYSYVSEETNKMIVMRNYIKFLNAASVQESNFIEWFVHVKHISGSDFVSFSELTAEFPNPNFVLVKQMKNAGL